MSCDTYKNSRIEYDGGGNDDDGNEESAGQFAPLVEIERIPGCLFINAVALKEVALTSALFRLLEEEKLDIVCESQSRTHAEVSHTIQVTVQAGYDTDTLARKLSVWAGRKARVIIN